MSGHDAGRYSSRARSTIDSASEKAQSLDAVFSIGSVLISAGEHVMRASDSAHVARARILYPMIFVAALGTVIGAALFIVAFGAALTGFMPALVVAIAAYPLAAAFLARLRPVPAWVPALALVVLPAPIALQFGVALLLEEGVLAALVWPGGLIAMFLLSLLGAWAQRRLAKPQLPSTG